MKPRFICRDGIWHCVGGTVVATGTDMHAAYTRWYQLRCLEA